LCGHRYPRQSVSRNEVPATLNYLIICCSVAFSSPFRENCEPLKSSRRRFVCEQLLKTPRLSDLKYSTERLLGCQDFPKKDSAPIRPHYLIILSANLCKLLNENPKFFWTAGPNFLRRPYILRHSRTVISRFCPCRIASATLKFLFCRNVQSSTLRSTPQELGGSLAVASKPALSLPKGRRHRVSLVRRSFSEGGSIELCLNL